MKNNRNHFGAITISYLFLGVLETLWELFHVSKTESTKLTTLLGITINNKISEHEISTTFGLTIRIVVMYLAYLAIVYTVVWIVNKNKK